MLGAFLIAHQPAALAAPIFGPWGGWLLGHGECTFSAVAPRASYSLLALGLAGFVGRLRVADESVRQGLAALLVFWSWLWLAAGLLSVANTAS